MTIDSGIAVSSGWGMLEGKKRTIRAYHRVGADRLQGGLVMTDLPRRFTQHPGIGFAAPHVTRMEEESGPEEEAGSSVRRGRASVELLDHWLDRLLEERQLIIQKFGTESLSKEDGFKLLEENGSVIATLVGPGSGQIAFRTEKVIYSILAFSAVVIVILSGLTATDHLPKEVTITFVGTVVGGVLATIAQKLGKVGR